MRYFRVIDEGYHPWGDPTYWLEINADGAAERELAEYPNGNVVSYDQTYLEDEYGGLGIMVVESGDNWWVPFEITKAEFEAKWFIHRPVNRSVGN